MMKARLFDMHCHLDFAPDASAAAKATHEQGLAAFSVTVTPREFKRAASELAGAQNVRVGLGLHPWQVADGTCGLDDVEAFEHLAHNERFIGEVGLDFAPRHIASREAQLTAIEHVAAACSCGGKLLSIHAVRAAGEVLDVVERFDVARRNDCVFHWFSGTSDELRRAFERGFFFSINPRMLASKRGRAYARTLPVSRLLLETDEPSAPGVAFDASAAAERLNAMLDDLADVRSVSRDELAEQIASTSEHLLFDC